MWIRIISIILGIAIGLTAAMSAFLDPQRIGRERKPFTADDYALNLIFYITTIAFVVLALIQILE